MSKLEVGSYFKIGGQGYEFKGKQNPGGEMVARTNADEPETQGSLHKTFSAQELTEQAVKIGPFCEVFPYATYAKEKDTWKRFFRKEIPIPFPPDELVDVLKTAKEKDLDMFDPHFLPFASFNKDGVVLLGSDEIQYPSGWRRMDDSFWVMQETQMTRDGFNVLSGSWVLIDKTSRPELENGKQMYPNDPLKKVIENSVITLLEDRIPAGSRFALSPDSVLSSIFPNLSDRLRIPENAIHFPSIVEYNVFNNLFYPEWEKVDTLERVRDVVRAQGSSYFVMGRVNEKGKFFIWNTSSVRSAEVGFRPMITFEVGEERAE